MFIKMFSLAVAVATIGCAAGSQAAPASSPPYASEAVSVRVSLADLDLNTSAGAKTSLRRIHNAAKQVCGEEPGPPEFEARHAYQGCMDDAVDRAVDHLGNPIVAALNGGRQTAVMASNGR